MNINAQKIFNIVTRPPLSTYALSNRIDNVTITVRIPKEVDTEIVDDIVTEFCSSMAVDNVNICSSLKFYEFKCATCVRSIKRDVIAMLNMRDYPYEMEFSIDMDARYNRNQLL